MFVAGERQQQSLALYLALPETEFFVNLAMLLEQDLYTCIWKTQDPVDPREASVAIFLASELTSDQLDTVKSITDTEDRDIVVLLDAPIQNVDMLAKVDLVLPLDEIAIQHQLNKHLKSKSKQQDLAHNQTLLLQQNAELQARHDELEQRLSRQKLEIQQLVDQVESQRRSLTAFELIKDAIVRNVSHELKTPLLQVKSAVSLIKEDPLDVPKLITYAENAVARLETHITNITLLGHSLEINPAPIAFRDAVDYTRRNLNRIWQRKSELDRISFRSSDDLPLIYADKQALSTVLQLLIDNAIKFSTDKIEINARHAGTFVEIEVRDNGIGIAEDKIDTIFETFYQVDPSSTRRYGGTGVGLAIVKLIVERHDSTIKVSSIPGKGSTFSFRLLIAP